MTDHDELRAVAERILAWSSNERNDFFRVGFMVCGIEDELRAALAAQPQPLFDGVVGDVCEYGLRRFDVRCRVVVYPVTELETPTGDET